MATKKAKPSAPVCVFCHRSAGVQFAIFNPRFAPFGTACVECERVLPEGTVVPRVPAGCMNDADAPHGETFYGWRGDS